MPKMHSLQLTTGLRYEQAGLIFRVSLDLPEERADGQGAALRIFAEDLATPGRRVPLPTRRARPWPISWRATCAGWSA
jgi:hypothetical protein